MSVNFIRPQTDLVEQQLVGFLEFVRCQPFDVSYLNRFLSPAALVMATEQGFFSINDKIASVTEAGEEFLSRHASIDTTIFLEIVDSLEKRCYQNCSQPLKWPDDKSFGMLIRDGLSHILYMTRQMRQFLDDDRADKALRWLCWIQGFLAGTSQMTIGEAKDQICAILRITRS